MKKKVLRDLYKEKRSKLTALEVIEFQESVFQQILNYDFSIVENIHVFLPIVKHKEINTYPIIDLLRKKNKRVIISRSDFEKNELSHFIFEKDTELVTNNWGIPEPINAVEFDVSKIDLVFVPLLISDQRNFRVGYGKGFYDRFLSECKPSVKTIGINFFKPIREIEDINEFDVSLHIVICPDK